jgi:uncharacterized protein (TIGR02145 family)
MKCIFSISEFLLLFILINSCKEKPTPPTITTTAPTEISYTTVTSGGEVTNEGGEPVTVRGVCWGTSANPTIANSATTESGGLGSFTRKITQLVPDTKYYIRAYATNIAGTGFGNEIQFTTKGTVTDIESNVYKVIQIGTQLWMKENLKTTKYNDGTAIPLITDKAAWANLTIPGYCWYNNDEAANKNVYGALYNWYTVNTGKLCPVGWHVQTNEEWDLLTTFLGGNNISGKLKEAGTVHWASPNTGATNVSGFTAMPGGQRSEDGVFDFALRNGLWWTSSEVSTQESFGIWIATDLTQVYSSMEDKRQGYSVRCLKDK